MQASGSSLTRFFTSMVVSGKGHVFYQNEWQRVWVQDLGSKRNDAGHILCTTSKVAKWSKSKDKWTYWGKVIKVRDPASKHEFLGCHGKDQDIPDSLDLSLSPSPPRKSSSILTWDVLCEYTGQDLRPWTMYDTGHSRMHCMHADKRVSAQDGEAYQKQNKFCKLPLVADLCKAGVHSSSTKRWESPYKAVVL